jgi:hypothetical protein
VVGRVEGRTVGPTANSKMVLDLIFVYVGQGWKGIGNVFAIEARFCMQHWAICCASLQVAGRVEEGPWDPLPKQNAFKSDFECGSTAERVLLWFFASEAQLLYAAPGHSVCIINGGG